MNAQANVNMSPRFIPEENDGLNIKIKPITEKISARKVKKFILFFKKNIERKGTIITERPVINADLDGVVYFRPAVCR